MIIKRKGPPSLQGWMALVQTETDLRLAKTRAYKAWMEIPVREWSDYVAAREVFKMAEAKAEGFSLAMRLLAQQQPEPVQPEPIRPEPAIDERDTQTDLPRLKLPGRKNPHG